MSDIKGPFEVYEYEQGGGLAIIDSTTRVVLDDVYAYDESQQARESRMVGIARALSICYGADHETAKTVDEYKSENVSLRAELEAVRREADRLRHGQQIEGDYVCPADLERNRLRSLLREALEIAGDAVRGGDQDYGSMAQRVEQIRKEAFGE